MQKSFVGTALIVGLVVVILVIIAVLYKVSQTPQEEKHLTAEQVIDLEVQAEQEHLRTQNQ